MQEHPANPWPRESICMCILYLILMNIYSMAIQHVMLGVYKDMISNLAVKTAWEHCPVDQCSLALIFLLAYSRHQRLQVLPWETSKGWQTQMWPNLHSCYMESKVCKQDYSLFKFIRFAPEQPNRTTKN